MRFLLDHQLSPRRVGRPLAEGGHDVRALAEEDTLQAMSDEEVLALAAAEARVLVTRNSRHFAPIAREWAEARRPHAGIVLIWTLKNNQHRAIVGRIEDLVAARPRQAQWRDLVVSV